jgi:hypothetical protein
MFATSQEGEMTRRLWPGDLMYEAGMKQVFRRELPFFNPLVNTHITMENHHFLMGKLTIFNSYVKLSEGNQQPLFQRCSQLPGMFNRLYHSCGYQF